GGRLRPFDDARPGGASGSGRREPRIPHVPRDRGGTVVRAVWAIFGRELRAYFFSPLAYVVLFFFLFINGILFSVIIGNLNDPRTPGGPPLAIFLGGNFVFWIILPFFWPILTMRLLSEELKTGSIEVLMTAPITEGQIVAGKYLAALA